MRRKIEYLLLILLTIIGILFCKDLDYKKQTFASLQANSSKINSICSKRRETGSNLLTQLLLNETPVYYCANDNTFYYSLVEDDINAYTPVVSWHDDINVVIQNKNITDKTIERNEKIKIYAYSDSEYKEYNLICTKLPIISINTSSKLENIDYQTADKDEQYKNYSMNLSIYDNEFDAEKNWLSYKGVISVRGNSSRDYEKKSFKIEIESKEVEDGKQPLTSLLNLRDANEYVLYAAYNDPTKVRNVFSSYLWYVACAKNNFANVNNGVYYKYCELFINDDYRGLYALGFAIDDVQEEILIGDYENNQIENIYKNVFGIEASNFDFNNPSNNGYEIKSNNGKGSYEPLITLYQYLLENKTDKLNKIIDINNSIDIYLFNNLVQNIDGIISDDGTQRLHNVYLTSKKYEESFKIIYAPWDLDRTWGLNFYDAINIDYDDNFIMEYNIVYMLLQNNDIDNLDAKELIENRYNELRSNCWSDDSILRILNNFEEEIFDSGAYAREKDKWPKSALIDDEYKLKCFKEYVFKRLYYFDEYIDKLVK